MIRTVLKYAALAIGAVAIPYLCFLGLLTQPFFQAHVVYLHFARLTWFKNLSVPEQFGFLHNQVTPFRISTSDGESLYAWHILPIGLYKRHETPLQAEPAGLVEDITTRHAFHLLRSDPDARLVIHFHGAAGTVGSGYRVPNYRALSAGKPENLHVLTFDYRGFGHSTGTPSEEGLILDAVTVVEWALHVAGIPPDRILLYSQSLGTAVNTAVAKHFATREPPTVFAGHILTAPFADVPTLVATYRIAGTLPILGPLAKWPMVFEFLKTFIREKWSSRERLAEYVRVMEEKGEKEGLKYKVTILHGEDDYDVPWSHARELFGCAVNATVPAGVTGKELEEVTAHRQSKVDLGEAGTVVKWRTERGVIREEILKHGLHDVIMGNPVVTLAVMWMLE